MEQPMGKADDLENKQLVCTSEIVAATSNVVDSAYVQKLENGSELCVLSSKGDEVSENKDSSVLTEVAFTRASVSRGKADNLENKELDCTCGIAASMANIVGSADVLKVENGNESCVSSSKGDERSENEKSPALPEVSLIQTSVSRADCNDDSNKLENDKSICTCEIAVGTTVSFDSGDTLKLDNGNEFCALSSLGDEVLENEESSIPTEVALVQASLSREDRSEDWNAIIDNQNGKANYGGEPKLYFREGSYFRMKYRAPRYFDPPQYSDLGEYSNRDKKLEEPGGNSKKDKKLQKGRKRKLCYNCGDIGHEGPSCKYVKACFICSKKGHLITDCQNRSMELDSSTPCLKCGNSGHDMFACNNDYSPEDLKNIQCIVCQDFGHLRCVDYKMDVPTEASCFKCGLPGHFGSDCALTEVPIALELEGLTKAPTAQEEVIFCSICRERGIIKRRCRQCKKARKKAEKKKITAEELAAIPVSAKVKKSLKHSRRMKNFMQTPTVTPYPIPYNVRWQSGPPPKVGPYYGKPRSNVWLSPEAAARPPPKLQKQPRFPHLIWSRPQVTQTPQQPLNQQSVILVPQVQIQVPTEPLFCSPFPMYMPKETEESAAE